MATLADFEVSPSKREAIIKQQNQGAVRRMQEIEAASDAQIFAQDAAKAITNDIQLQDIMFQQETAKVVLEAQTDFDAILTTQQNNFLGVSRQLAQTMTDLDDANQRRFDKNLPWGQRRKAEKEFEELNNRARNLESFRQEVGEDLAATNIVRQQALQNLVATRNAQQQLQTDVGAAAKHMELERKVTKLQLRDAAHKERFQTLMAMQTLTPGEITANKDFESVGEFLVFQMRRGVDMANATDKDYKQAEFMLGQSTPEQRRDLAYMLPIYERGKRENENFEYHEFVQLALREGRLAGAKLLAEVAADKDLLNLIQAGENRLISQEYQKNLAEATAKAGPAGLSGQDIAIIKAQSEQTVREKYADRIPQAAMDFYSADLSERTSAAGSTILQPETFEAILRARGFNDPRLLETVKSEEFQAVSKGPLQSDGSPLLSAADKYAEIFAKNKIPDAVSMAAISELITQSAKINYNSTGGQFSQLSAIANQYGFDDARTKLFTPMPQSVQMRTNTRNKPSYEISTPTDLATALAVLRAGRKPNYLDMPDSSSATQQIMTGRATFMR